MAGHGTIERGAEPIQTGQQAVQEQAITITTNGRILENGAPNKEYRSV